MTLTEQCIAFYRLELELLEMAELIWENAWLSDATWGIRK